MAPFICVVGQVENVLHFPRHQVTPYLLLDYNGLSTIDIDPPFE